MPILWTPICRNTRGGRRAPRFPIPGRTPIHERPFDPGDRGGFGHWEADSVIGTGCHLHTEVERRTRFLMAAIIPDRTADESVGAQLAMFSPLPAGARASVTHDNGAEFARHARLRDELRARDVPFDAKPFKAHFTLARRARIPHVGLPHLAFPQNDEATDVTLYKSTLDRAGAVYKPLHTVCLGTIAAERV